MSPQQPAPFQTSDAGHLTENQGRQITAEVTALLTPQQIRDFREARITLARLPANDPAIKAAQDRLTETQKPVDAVIATVFTRHGISTATPRQSTPSTARDADDDGNYRITAEEYDALVERQNRNKHFANQLIQNLTTPPAVQQPKLQQGGPGMTPGGAAPGRTMDRP